MYKDSSWLLFHTNKFIWSVFQSCILLDRLLIFDRNILNHPVTALVYDDTCDLVLGLLVFCHQRIIAYRMLSEIYICSNDPPIETLQWSWFSSLSHNISSRNLLRYFSESAKLFHCYINWFIHNDPGDRLPASWNRHASLVGHVRMCVRHQSGHRHRKRIGSLTCWKIKQVFFSFFPFFILKD